jgi:dihydrodipicolinate synthase/N-acetylneuraminate lyase
VAVITPYFLPATDAALLDFYTEVSAISDGLGVFVYIFKDRTGITVSPELMAEIAKLPNIIGVKISGESLETVGKFRDVLPDDFLVFTGSDREIGRLVDVGAQGVISGIASVYPEPFVAMADAVAAGDMAERGDIERLKAGLRRQGIAAGRARMSVGAPDAATDAHLDHLHQKYGTTL